MMMTVRKIPFLVGEYYHIYNRGVDKRIVFSDERDYRRFVVLLYLCNGTNPVNMSKLIEKGLPFSELFNTDKGDQLVGIGAYCLMSNHFHILIYEHVEGGISMFMEKLSTAYSMYFNKKNERTGNLFEGTFKARHIDSEPYLNWVFSYIHLNPVKLIVPNWKENGISDSVAIENFMRNYKYSSYYEYFTGDRAESGIINKDAFPDYFSQLNDLGSLIQEFRINDY